MNTILIVDDDEALCRSLNLHLKIAGYEVKYAMTMAEGLSVSESWSPDLILLDLNLPDEYGLTALPRFIGADVPVIIMTAESSNHAVVEAMQAGAFDYLRKPMDLDSLLGVLSKASLHLKHRDDREDEPAPAEEDGGSTRELVGAHASIIEVHKQLGCLARTREAVLIHGESGTGKELAARILHEAKNPKKPFVAINCSAVVSTLLESEFFGHEKGAFTGADTIKKGKLEYAAGGTVFLDEIGDMPLNLQAKLLRVLQEEEFMRVGGLQMMPLTARVIAATHHNLEEQVNSGSFRKDLFYRLSVSCVNLPPLRAHKTDIPLLVNYLLKKIAGKQRRRIPTVASEAIDLLMTHAWTGNVRELENVLTRTLTMARGSFLTAADFQASLPVSKTVEDKGSESLSLAHAEKRHILKTMESTGGNITHTAKSLGISPTTLRKKLIDYQSKQEEQP